MYDYNCRKGIIAIKHNNDHGEGGEQRPGQHGDHGGLVHAQGHQGRGGLPQGGHANMNFDFATSRWHENINFDFATSRWS